MSGVIVISAAELEAIVAKAVAEAMPDRLEEGDIIRISDAANLLDIAPATLRRMAHAGQVPCIRFGIDGGELRFSRKVLALWVKKSPETSSF